MWTVSWNLPQSWGLIPPHHRPTRDMKQPLALLSMPATASDTQPGSNKACGVLHAVAGPGNVHF